MTTTKIRIEILRTEHLIGGTNGYEEAELNRTWGNEMADEPLCRAIVKVVDHYNGSDGQERAAVLAVLCDMLKE